jgi:putative transposase
MVKETTYGISRACRTIGISRSYLNYQSQKDDGVLIDKLKKIAGDFPKEGFLKAFNRLRNKGMTDNKKRVYRVYRSLWLTLRSRTKKRLPARVKHPIIIPRQPHHTWSIDFMSDSLESGRKFRSFNVMDDYNREALYIENDFSIKSSRVIWVLNHLVSKHKVPSKIRMDNGPELIAKTMKLWSEFHQIEFLYIQPGKPTQNALIERFNRTYRENVLDSYLFNNIDQVREQTDLFIKDYNHYRPHEALDNKPPVVWKYGQLGKHTSPPKPDHITTTINDDNDKIIKKI